MQFPAREKMLLQSHFVLCREYFRSPFGKMKTQEEAIMEDWDWDDDFDEATIWAYARITRSKSERFRQCGFSRSRESQMPGVVVRNRIHARQRIRRNP